jgi:erythromycin esterase-like protein
MNETKSEELFDLADELASLREQKEAIAEASKENGEEIERVQSELIRKMADSEVPSFNRKGNKFTLAVSSHFSQVAERRDELFEALRDNNCGDIIVEKIDPRTLSKTVNELCEENDDALPEWLTGLVSGFEKPIIRVNKQK